jgi:hypothetical protein
MTLRQTLYNRFDRGALSINYFLVMVISRTNIMPRESNSSFGKLLRLEVLVMRPWNRIRFMERDRDAMQPL